MLSIPFILILILLAILFVPVFLLTVFFQAVSFSFEKLGLAPEAFFAILLCMFIGSFINIPLGRRKLVEVQESRFFGLVRRTRMRSYGLSVNVGGALIPIALALYLLFRVPLQETLLATALLIIISYKLAKYVPNRGITVPLLFPPLFATIFALILAPEAAPAVAFISGVFGVLIGADILHLPRVLRSEQGILSIGGAGVFDGIFLIAIVAAFLAGF